jgi:hypothetical protein
MDFHSVIYVAIALVYAEAAVNSALERKYHCACREAVIAVLYTLIPLVVLDPLAHLLIAGTTSIT